MYHATAEEKAGSPFRGIMMVGGKKKSRTSKSAATKLHSREDDRGTKRGKKGRAWWGLREKKRRVVTVGN